MSLTAITALGLRVFAVYLACKSICFVGDAIYLEYYLIPTYQGAPSQMSPDMYQFFQSYGHLSSGLVFQLSAYAVAYGAGAIVLFMVSIPLARFLNMNLDKL